MPIKPKNLRTRRIRMTVSKDDLAAAKKEADDLESDLQGLLRHHARQLAENPSGGRGFTRGGTMVYLDVAIPPKMRERLAKVADAALLTMMDALRLVLAEAGRRTK